MFESPPVMGVLDHAVSLIGVFVRPGHGPVRRSTRCESVRDRTFRLPRSLRLGRGDRLVLS